MKDWVIKKTILFFVVFFKAPKNTIDGSAVKKQKRKHKQE